MFSGSQGHVREDIQKIVRRKSNFFGIKNFFVSFDFKNDGKNEFEDNNENFCSRFKNKIPLKIDFRADWTHESNPTAWELIINKLIILS